MNWLHQRRNNVQLRQAVIISCLCCAVAVTLQIGPRTFSSLVAPQQVHAQAEQEVYVPEDTIFRKSQQPERIKELFDLYLARVEKHREIDKRFRVSKAQFEKLSTLQSLEEAIGATREAFISRDEVLITYLELLDASLEDTAGVDIQIKQQTLQNLEKMIIELRAHLEKTKTTTDRATIATRADEFALLHEQILSVAAVARAQIVVGTLQNVYDKTRLIYDQVRAEQAAQEVSALKLQERQRAYAEVDREMESVAAQLEQTRLQFASLESRSRSDLGSNLERTYTGTAQLLSYVKELALDN